MFEAGRSYEGGGLAAATGQYHIFAFVKQEERVHNNQNDAIQKHLNSSAVRLGSGLHFPASLVSLCARLPFFPVIGRVGVASAQLRPPPPGQVHTSALDHHHHISNRQIVTLMVARPNPGLHFGLIISVLHLWWSPPHLQSFPCVL